MQKLLLTIRFVLFAVFFLAGSGAIVLSILSEPELKEYYQSRGYLAQIQKQNEKIKSLTDQYQRQITLIESEPNILQRLAPLTFGRKPQAPDTAFPQADNQALKARTETLMSQIAESKTADPIPAWLRRVLEPRIRRGLFGAGAGLVLITFMFFGITKPETNNQGLAD